MDVAVILTYRCNSKCSMCHIWQNPTHPKDEITLETLNEIPSGIDYLNLTGGEPTLREDLVDIVDLLYSRAMQLEISSNGLVAERLVPIIQKYPDVKIRFSLDGIGDRNNSIRGEKDGYKKKTEGLLLLKEVGGCDLGFAMTLQDENCDQAVQLFQFANRHGFEFATSSLHNGFQFHKGDNIPYNRSEIASHFQALITEMLKTNDIKTWFRAYLNLGLLRKVLGHDRFHPCTAGTDFVFIDPWSDLYACNVRPDLKIGNLKDQNWDELFHGSRIQEIRSQVALCKQNCWMVGLAKTAMRNKYFSRLPKLNPLFWVLLNKLRVTLGMNIDFFKYLHLSDNSADKDVPIRKSYLGVKVKRKLQGKTSSYDSFGPYTNR